MKNMKRLGLSKDIDYVQKIMREYIRGGGNKEYLPYDILRKLYIGNLIEGDFCIKDCWNPESTKYWIPILSEYTYTTDISNYWLPY